MPWENCMQRAIDSAGISLFPCVYMMFDQRVLSYTGFSFLLGYSLLASQCLRKFLYCKTVCVYIYKNEEENHISFYKNSNIYSTNISWLAIMCQFTAGVTTMNKTKSFQNANSKYTNQVVIMYTILWNYGSVFI